ncbi:two-CW domain-containing protein [Candidatus Aquicultor secundus]|uniref:two-CW domain-containing protein n=2 Tax=Candidatus Aquicultor secundus TaxID=1973895 RepID=UPI00338F1F05
MCEISWMVEELSMDCWEFMRCDKGTRLDCAAYPNNGYRCWLDVGTLCGKKIQGIHAKKISACSFCDFYKSMHVRTLVNK